MNSWSALLHLNGLEPSFGSRMGGENMLLEQLVPGDFEPEVRADNGASAPAETSKFYNCPHCGYENACILSGTHEWCQCNKGHSWQGYHD